MVHELTKTCTKFYSRREKKSLFGILKVDGEDNIEMYVI